MRQVAHTAARQNQKRWSRTTTPAKQFIERLQRSLPFDTSAPQSTTLMTLFDRDFRGGDGIHAEKGPAILPNHAKKGPMRMVWGGLGIFPTSCRTSQHRADPRRYVWGEWAIFPAFHHETRVCQTQHTLHSRSPNPTTLTKWSSAPTRHGGSACTRVSDSRCQDAMSLFSKPAVTVSVYGTAV